MDSFNDNPGATIGASNFNHIFNFGDTDLKLDIWDTAGQEVYRSLNRIFYKDAQIAILAYNITNENSFKNISSIWFPQVKECVDPSAIIVICGNKCDRYNEEQVKEEEAKKYAENIGASFIQTSAPRGTGIKEMFSQAGKQYLALLGVGCQEDDNKGKVKLDKKILKKKKDDKDSCC